MPKLIKDEQRLIITKVTINLEIKLKKKKL